MKSSILLTLFFAILTLSGCQKDDILIENTTDSKDTNAANTQRSGINFPRLRYNQVTFKGSHNSYERNESIATQLNHNLNQKHNDNCLALEFDIWRNTYTNITKHNIPEDFWVVAHTFHPGRRNKLSGYLKQVKDWSNSHPNHMPIMVKLDIKSNNGGYQEFHNQIDFYLRRFMGDNKIYWPNQMFRDRSKSLSWNVRQHGWPTMDQLRGKIIFVLTGNGNWGIRYADSGPKNRVCYTMRGINMKSKDSPAYHANQIVYNNPNIIFWNISMRDAKKNDRFEPLGRELAKYNMITRVYSANNEGDWLSCIRAGITCISTDKIRNHGWARAFRDHYPFTKRNEI
ncbi:Ca2+-dependent phosphoinositide-specific phospholipase C [Flavivirga aquatica]|nr:Ca2+-dependent phosphoinositide-specific phospholipase C [Flavivirga aquatica]